MKLSASINFFDGAELLIPSLATVRSAIDHVSVVFQEVSNFGHPVTVEAKNALRQATTMGLVDEVMTYVPQPQLGGGGNEFEKRAIGVQSARAAGADAIILMDVDEFYELAPFLRAKRRMVDEDLDYTSVHYKNYYRYPTWMMKGAPEGSVPFICRLNDRTMHERGGRYPVPVDPTRVLYVNGGRHHLFSEHEIMMHHMTGVRLDLQEKIDNSSNNDHQHSRDTMKDLLAGIHLMHPGSGLLTKGEVFQIETVHDRFNLLPIFSPGDSDERPPQAATDTDVDHDARAAGEAQTRLCSIPWQKFFVNTNYDPPRAAPCRNHPLLWNGWDLASLSFALDVLRTNLFTGSLEGPCRDCQDKDLAPISELLDVLDQEGLVGYEGNRMVDAMQELMASPAPAPPPHLNYRVTHTRDSQSFLASGMISLFDVMSLIQKYDKADPCRLLDWGCGSGRMALHIARRHPEIELTGCDIDSEAVDWCRREIATGDFHHINPEPATPLARGRFTSIVGFSIVNHLTRDLQQRWIPELHDLLSDDGIMVLTTLGEKAAGLHGLADRLATEGIIDERTDATLDDIVPTGYYRSTFQSRAWTEAMWGPFFHVIDYIEAGAFGLQDIIILRKNPSVRKA